MESHESAGIPENEYVRLRRQMWRTGVLTGVSFAYAQLVSSIRNHAYKGLLDFLTDLILLLPFSVLFGWFLGYCSWGPEKEKVLTEYKKRILEPVRRMPIGKSNKAPLITVYAALSGICWLILYLYLFHHTLAEFFVPAFAVEAVMVVQLYEVIERGEMGRIWRMIFFVRSGVAF